jgi:Flp pilus assembly protein TadG
LEYALFRRRLGSIGSAERGAAALEFALACPAFLALVFGIIDGGRIFMADQDVATAAREGTRYALSGSHYLDCAGISQAATRLTIRSNVAAADITVSYDHGPGTAIFASCPTPSLAAGDRVIVTATRRVDPVFPLFRSMTLTATARRTVTMRTGS